MLRDAMDKQPEMSLEQSLATLDRCMKVLYYRDARSLNKYEIAIVSKDGAEIKPPIVSETNWHVAHLIKFLWNVDKTGVAYEASSVASAYGAYISGVGDYKKVRTLSVLRDTMNKQPEMSFDQALATLDRCMKILYYRDARSLNTYEVAIVSNDGAEIKTPIVSETNWDVAHLIKGYE